MQTPFPHPVRTVWKLLAQLRRDNPNIANAECARQLGTNPNTIAAWLKAPLYQSYENWFLEKSFEQLPLSAKLSRSDVKEQLDEFAVEMLHRLQDIVETTGDEKLIATIGFDMLDRAGYAEPKRDAQRPINFILTPETLAILAQRGREAVGSSHLLDGEVVGGA